MKHHFSDIINLSARWCFCYFTSEGSARKDFLCYLHGTEKDETNSNIYRDCVGNRINPWTDCIYTDHIVSKRNFNAIYKKGKLHYTRNGLPFTDPFYLSFICAVYDLNGGTSKR